MTIAEGVSTLVAYKFYASGAMTENALDDTSTLPGPSGAQLVRRVTSTMDLVRNNYAATEIRADRQEVDFRLGTGHTAGDITGEYSGATYFDFIEAVHRDTRVAALTLTESDLTSATASHSGSSFTFGGGDPVALGLFVGDVIRFANLSVTADDAVNFTILGFSGTSNRVLAVTPAPSDQTADVAFTLTRPGHTTIVPASGHVSRKLAIEHYGQDTDYSQLFVENRLWKYVLTMPATGLVTFSTSLMGRWAYDLSGGSAPYFASPAAETTTGITAAVNGILLLNGTAVGVVTGATITNETVAAVGEVVGQNFPAAISLGHNQVSGQITAYLNGSTIPALFKAETECALLIGLDATSAPNTPTTRIYLPRIKFTGATAPVQGEGLQVVTAPFRALRYVGSAAGVPSTVIRIQDTEA